KGVPEKEIYQILLSKSRDNARTPTQWNDQAYAGFSDVESWIEPIYNYKDINVEKNLEDQDSVLYYYQKLIQLRKQYQVISLGTYKPLRSESPTLYADRCQYQDQ